MQLSKFSLEYPGVGKWFDDYTIKTGTKIAFEDDNIVVSQTPEQVNTRV